MLAPSSALLRFLRAQSQDIHFFTPSNKATICHSTSRTTLPPKQINSNPHRSYPRNFTASHRRHASVEASLFNLDFLEVSSKQGARNSPAFIPTRWQNTSGSRTSLEGQNKSLHTSEYIWPSLSRFWGFRRRRANPGLRPNDLPPLPSFLDDASGAVLGRSKVGKASNELKLRCTEVNENGDVTLVNGEFKKSELIAKYGLLPRDLRKIDSSLLPHILVRPSAILINLLHLRVLIKHNRVLVLDAYGTTDSYTQSLFMYDLDSKLHQKETSRQAGGLPYEFRALEAVLISVTSGLEGEFEGVSEPVVRVLRELEEDIDRDKLRHLLIYSKKLSTFEQKARLVRDAIDDLLDADDDLVAMYLSERAQGKFRAEADHTEVEMLLESYHKVCDEIVQVSGNLVNNIRNTEEIVKAILDANRNSLMLLDLKFSIGTLGIGSGAFVAGLYGMNLKNFIEESDMGFVGLTGLSMTCMALICAFGLTRLRKVQRVSMWGEKEARKRGSWNDVGEMPIGAGEGTHRRLIRRGEEGKEVLPLSGREVVAEKGKE